MFQVSPRLAARRVATVLLLLGATAGLRAQISHFSAFLTGDQTVPPVTTAATGWGIVTLTESTRAVRIFVESQGLSPPISTSPLRVPPARSSSPWSVARPAGLASAH